jgi:hypothetical protein
LIISRFPDVPKPADRVQEMVKDVEVPIFVKVGTALNPVGDSNRTFLVSLIL